MRDTTKHRKDDLVPKGFLYAISIMVMLSLAVVFSASLFPGNKFDVPEKVEIFEKEKFRDIFRSYSIDRYSFFVTYFLYFK